MGKKILIDTIITLNTKDFDEIEGLDVIALELS
jgi:hypothetical protein